jgi:hypothetical protein
VATHGHSTSSDYAKVKGFSVIKEEVPGTRMWFMRLYTCFKGHRTLANFERPDPKRTEREMIGGVHKRWLFPENEEQPEE